MNKIFWLAIAYLSCATASCTLVSAQEDAYRRESEYLGLNSLENDVSHRSSILGVRIIEEYVNRMSSYTVFLCEDKSGLHGSLYVLTKFSAPSATSVFNFSELTELEIGKILDVINRRELLFVPSEFTPVARGEVVNSEKVSVEIVSTRPAKHNFITRSLMESDSVHELREWIVAFTTVPKRKWNTEER